MYDGVDLRFDVLRFEDLLPIGANDLVFSVFDHLVGRIGELGVGRGNIIHQTDNHEHFDAELIRFGGEVAEQGFGMIQRVTR